MIKLSDISIDYVLYGSEQRFVNLAKENNCYSIEDLISLTKEYPKYDWDIVNKRIDELKLIVDKSSIKVLSQKHMNMKIMELNQLIN